MQPTQLRAVSTCGFGGFYSLPKPDTAALAGVRT
jgi:hypothetical protein